MTAESSSGAIWTHEHGETPPFRLDEFARFRDGVRDFPGSASPRACRFISRPARVFDFRRLCGRSRERISIPKATDRRRS